MPRPVLRLRQQVRRGKFRLGRLIGQHQHLARSRQQINRHVAEQQPLGGDHVGVARAKNLLHAPDGGRAISHRGNRLRAAGTINLCGPRQPRRIQQRRD